MACDTFIKIASKCKRHFVALQPGESEPFIDEIVRTMKKITCDLAPQQVHTFYEACGNMINAQGQKSVQERLIQELMSLPNQAVSLQYFSGLSSTKFVRSGIKSSNQPIETRALFRMVRPSRSSAISRRPMWPHARQSAAIFILRLEEFTLIC